MAKALDFGARFDGHTGAKEDIRADDGIAADMGVEGEEHGFRRGQGDTIVQRIGAGAGLKGGLGGGEFGAGVDAHGFRLVADHDTGGQAALAGQFHDIGQVVFAGCIGIADLGHKREERFRIGADNAGVAECYGAFFV